MSGPSPGSPGAARRDLTADCARCTALCCVVPAFAASADFAVDKPAGVACPNLLADHRCGIHDRLRDRGFPGCVVFDCFGAGQYVTEVARPAPQRVGAVLRVARGLHELLWLLVEAGELTGPGGAGEDGGLAHEVDDVRAHVQALLRRPEAELAVVDTDAERAPVGALLDRVGRRVRGARPGPDHRHADLVGARLRGADLRRATLRGALLLGADLRRARLDRADLLGADLRGADLAGADLAGALFLTGPQLEAARGDARTAVPAHLARPAHWATGASPTR